MENPQDKGYLNNTINQFDLTFTEHYTQQKQNTYSFQVRAVC